MRRAQIDDGSQPIRNLAGNPSFETVGSSSTLRQNLAQYPNLEYIGANTTLRTNLLTNPGLETLGSTNNVMRTNLALNPSMNGGTGFTTVRTNLCTNPRGINAFPQYSSGSQTITANVAITGHPEGLTTANRVTYTGVTPSNPGVSLTPTLTTGTQYTISAWVYFESTQTTPGSTSFAETGVISGPAVTPTIGVWQKVSWTRTVTSATPTIGFRTAASDGGTGSFLITGVVLEVSPVVYPNFYDGATAPQTNLVKVAASQTGGVTFTDNVSYAGSTWRRAAVVAGSGGPLVRQYVTLSDLGAGGKTYTVAVTVANDQAFTQQVNLDWCDASPSVNYTLAAGEQKRLVLTVSKATYDATFRFADISITQSATEGRSILYKDWLIEEGTTSGDYYVATGDFSYAWTGTANASSSTQRVPALSGYNSASVARIGKSLQYPKDTSYSMRVIPITAGRDTYAEIAGVTLATGVTYTISATVRLEAAQTGTPDSRARRIVVYHSNAAFGSTMAQSTQATNAAGITTLSVTVPVTDGAQPQSIRLYNGAGAGEGDIWWDNLLIEATDIAKPYFDGGSTPSQDMNHAWSGTADASTSLMRANLPAGMANSGGRFGYQSTEWSARGTKSVKIVHALAATSTNPDQFVELQGMTSGTLLANTTYTISGTCRTTQVLGGTLDSRALKFYVAVNSVILTITYSKTKPNAAGASRVVGTFTTGTDTNLSFLRVYGGASYGNGDVWWDELCLEQGITDGTYFDGAETSAANMLTNGGFEVNTTGWGGAGINPGTLTRITSSSHSGSACVQVAVDGTNVLQGAFTSSNRPVIKPHMTYTAVAWVKGDAGKMMAIECGELDSSTTLIGRTQSTPVSATGGWQKLTATRSMGANAAYGDVVIRNYNAVAHTFYVDSVMYLQSDTAPVDYYAGNGDFTYAWSGTAHASTSLQQAPSLGGWGSASTGKSYSSVNSPLNGTRCAGVLTQGLTGDGLYHNDITVVAGNTYTMSAWIKTTSTLSNLSAYMRWKDNSNAILQDDLLNVSSTLVVGAWTRVSATYTAVAGATRLQAMWRIPIGHTPTTFYVDSMMVEQSSGLGTYFDGTTSATTEFTHAWTGTANQSISSQSAIGLSGVSAGRNSAVIESKHYVFSSVAEDGKKTAKWVSPAGTANSGWRIASINGNNVLGFTPNIKAGGVYTLWFRYRATGWQGSHTFQVQVADTTSQNVVAAYDTPRLINSSTWTDYRRTFVAQRDATAATVMFVSLPLTPQATVDGVFEIRRWMLVEGEYNGDYIDGTRPFSKWDGAAHSSTSVGYAPQLLDLAGKPLVDVSAVGATTLPGGFTNSEPRTLYTVYNNLQDISDSSVWPILTYGATALNDVIPNQYITLRLQSATGIYDNSICARRTGGAGANAPGSKIGVNVVSYGLNATGSIFGQANNGSIILDGFTMDMPHEKINILPATAYGSHIRTIIYRGYHDDATRAAVSRYLGNKYGAIVA